MKDLHDVVDDYREAPKHAHHRPEIAGFALLVQVFAEGGYQELTVSDLEERTGLSKGQLRGALHTGADMGWFRPIRNSPTDARIARWTLSEALPLLAEHYRQALVARAQDLNDQVSRLASPNPRLFPRSTTTDA